MRFLILISVLFLNPTSWGQELEMGMSFATNAYQRTHLGDVSFTSQNGYITYFERREGQGVIDKHNVFNSIVAGTVFSFSYKRFTVVAEPQFSFQRSVFRFDEVYTIDRIVGKKSFRLPFFITYKFFKSEKSIYGLAGVTFHRERVYDYQDPGSSDVFMSGKPPYTNTPDFGNYHFYGAIYDEYPYFNSTFGLGKKFNRINVSLRYNRLLDITRHDILATIWQVELHVGFKLLSTKDFTRKHYLYVE